MTTILGIIMVIVGAILFYFIVRGKANQLWSDMAQSGPKAISEAA